MINIKQPALALHSCDVPGYLYQMATTWQMPAGASGSDVAYWIGSAVNQAQDQMLANVVINCHGLAGALYVGGNNSPPMDLAPFSQLRSSEIGMIWLVSCLVAIGSNGQSFCSQLAVAVGCDVVAADDEQFVEGRFLGGKTDVFGAIDDFEGTAYVFSPSGSVSLFSIHDPIAENYS
jgi:Domain of unknown function (DUF4347)